MSNKLEATFHGSRDPRWEDVYASQKSYHEIHIFKHEGSDEGPCYLCSCTIFRIDVEYKGKNYFYWQIFDPDDVKDFKDFPEAHNFFWNQMVEMTDRVMIRTK